MSERQKKTETFIIKIMNQQNSTWQGKCNLGRRATRTVLSQCSGAAQADRRSTGNKEDSEDTCSDKR